MIIYLVRHAKAGHRGDDLAMDRHRHLSPSGLAQAEEIAGYFLANPVERILSSPYARCVETVAPAAAELGLEVEARESLAEETTMSRLHALLDELVAQDAAVALCSHGNVIPAALDLLGKFSPEALACAKGSVTRLDTRSGSLEYMTFSG
ncbi:MAG: phosphoglycerate mutase family protein [Actinomycetota bacterium]|nr:phosphoglycerate mutase family protein [Actinomycetota bacterium]